eukprot:6520254-Pyramimonas_sp.AAC.2
MTSIRDDAEEERGGGGEEAAASCSRRGACRAMTMRRGGRWSDRLAWISTRRLAAQTFREKRFAPNGW